MNIPLHHVIRPGIVHFMAFPATMKGEGPIVETVRQVLTDDFFSFFSPVLGWVGVFLTGSDASCNFIFGNLQTTAARQVGLNPVLTAAANSAGGVMGRMISVQSIAVAAAATSMKPSEESQLFRFTFWHSVLLVCLIGVVTTIFAYVIPWIVP